jgi:PREDICTED: similar to CG33182-PA
MPGEEKNWKCDRCKNSDYGISCILCPLRGGALKRTQDENKWVHITCALMQPGVSFQDGIYKSPIDITQIKKARGHGSPVSEHSQTV